MGDILDEYGPDSSQPQEPRGTNDMAKEKKELPYSPPVGPSNINDGRSPGLHGTNHGNAGTQGRR